MIEANVAALSAPADRLWILARVAALLMSYYVADMPAEIMRFDAEDWEDGLREFPEWAITKAVRWWKGEANLDRRRKPLVGDIAIRARHEMRAVYLARAAMKRFDDGKLPSPRKQCEDQTPVDLDERRRIAAEILTSVGYRPRTFGSTE